MQPTLTFLDLSSILLTLVEKGKWHPGIGDPSVGGWLTAAGYFLAALISFHRAWTVRSTPHFGHRPLIFWIICGTLMLLLGINKQLDLQQWLTQTGRDWARAGGWYEERRAFQALFVKWVVGLTIASLIAAGWFIRRLRFQYHMATLGLIFTACFIVVRAASFHHVDQFLGFHSTGFGLNRALEISGIAIVAIAAMIPDRSKAFEDKPAPLMEAG